MTASEIKKSNWLAYWKAANGDPAYAFLLVDFTVSLYVERERMVA